MMEQTYYIGIDGGATKTTSILSNAEGKLMNLVEGGGTNIYKSPEYKSELEKLLESTLSQRDVPNPIDLGGICLGLAGAGLKEDQEKIKLLVLEKMIQLQERSIVRFSNTNNIIVTPDMVIALATEKKPGENAVILISGTGCIAYGENSEGKNARVGGWGSLVSDDGSGSWIGRQAIKAIIMAYDMRGENTRLTEPILNQLSFFTIDELLTWIRKNELLKRDQAALAPLVEKAAIEGDYVSIAILEQAGIELAKYVIAVAKQLGFSKHPFSVITSGGVINNIQLVQDAFYKQIKSEEENVEIKPLTQSPAVGAINLALTKFR